MQQFQPNQAFHPMVSTFVALIDGRDGKYLSNETICTAEHPHIG